MQSERGYAFTLNNTQDTHDMLDAFDEYKYNSLMCKTAHTNETHPDKLQKAPQTGRQAGRQSSRQVVPGLEAINNQRIIRPAGRKKEINLAADEKLKLTQPFSTAAKVIQH